MVSYEDLQKMRVVDLKAAVRSWQHSNRIPRYSSMRKAQLIEAMHKEIQLGQPAEDTLEKHVARVLAAPKKSKRGKGKKKAPPPEESEDVGAAVSQDAELSSHDSGPAVAQVLPKEHSTVRALRKMMGVGPHQGFTRPQLSAIIRVPTGKMFRTMGKEHKATDLLKKRAAFALTLMKKQK